MTVFEKFINCITTKTEKSIQKGILMQSYSEHLKSALRKIILYGYPILFLLITLAFYLGTYDSAQVKITMLYYGGLFLIMCWFVLKIEEFDLSFFKKNFVFILPILLFLISGIISFAISPFKYASYNELIKRFIYSGFTLMIISEFNDERKILSLKNLIIVTSYIVCIYGTIQVLDILFFPPPPDSGLDPFLWRQAFGNKIFSTFGNPNFFGDFLIVINPIVLAMFLHKRKFYLGFLWILILICTIFTFSKGAWLGFAAGTFVFIVAYAYLVFKNKFTKEKFIYSIIIALFILSIAFAGILTLSKKRPDSISFRLFTWVSTWEMINTKPVIGTGIGTFYVTYPSWRRPQIFFIEGKHNTESDHPENEYLEIWFDEGIIGLTLFLLLISLVIVAGYKNMDYLYSSKKTRAGPIFYFQLGLFAAIIAKLSHDLVCVSLRFVSSGITLWLLIALVLSISINIVLKEEEEDIPAKIEKSSKLKPLIKIILQLLVIAIFAFLIYSVSGSAKANKLHLQAIKISQAGQDWEKAIFLYDQVNKYNPGYPMSKYFKANAYLDRWAVGDDIKAKAVFEDLWKIAPNYVQSKFLCGTMYAKMFEGYKRKKEKAISSGESQDIIDTYALKEKESFDNAIRYFNEYILMDPIFPVTYYHLADIYGLEGMHEEAINVLKQHINYPQTLDKPPHNIWVENWQERRFGDYAETYSRLGNICLLRGDFKFAEEYYLKAIELNPNHKTVFKNLSVLYFQQGEKDKYIQAWYEVRRIDPKDPDLQNALKALEHSK